MALLADEDVVVAVVGVDEGGVGACVEAPAVTGAGAADVLADVGVTGGCDTGVLVGGVPFAWRSARNKSCRKVCRSWGSVLDEDVAAPLAVFDEPLAVAAALVVLGDPLADEVAGLADTNCSSAERSAE
jgi:hypothetical protein